LLMDVVDVEVPLTCNRLSSFGEEGEMDFDVVFVHFLAKKEDLFASIYGATVVTVLEDLEV